jgi:hypothetical protein
LEVARRKRRKLGRKEGPERMLALFSGITAEKAFGYSWPLPPGRL